MPKTRKKRTCYEAIYAVCAVCADGRRDAGVRLRDQGIEPTTSTPVQEATPAPTPTLPPYEANALTGEARDADYPAGQRITAVMVNNITRARPQRGLSDAQMLFEIKVEGGITRFMALYNDYHDIQEVGPIRSGRDQFFQLILPWQALYIHEGESVVMEQYAADYDYGLLNNNDGANGYRDYNRVNWLGESYNNGLPIEHTMYTSGENIQQYIDSNSVDMNRDYTLTFFNFVDYRQDNPVRDLSNSQDSAYVLDEWPRWSPTAICGDHPFRQLQDPLPVCARHHQLHHAAVLLHRRLLAGYGGRGQRHHPRPSPTCWCSSPTSMSTRRHEAKDLQNVDDGPGGIGYYSYGGKTERIYWQRGTSLEALRLYYLTEDGQCSDVPLGSEHRQELCRRGGRGRGRQL